MLREQVERLINNKTKPIAALNSSKFYHCVTPDDTSKANPSVAKKLSGASFTAAFLFAVGLFAFLPFLFLVIVPLLVVVTVLLNRYFARRIGGHTGDCLDTVQQVAAIICYVTILMLWKFT